jgi:hypothetical protein
MLIVGPNKHSAPLAFVSAASTVPISLASSMSKVAPRQVALGKEVAGAIGQTCPGVSALTHLVGISTSCA